MQSYSFEEKDQEKIRAMLQSIQEKVETKLVLLINHVFNESKTEFYSCLRIEKETEDVIAVFEHLMELKDEILKYEINEVPEPLLEEFAQSLLSTNKLVDQINKLIIKNFG